jgi:CheY-like chemotaxis protein
METATTKPVPQKTILVVDDSGAIRTSVRKLFLSKGFDLCEEASNGHEAIAVAEKCEPDLIILDLSMPVMNGLEAAPERRRSAPDAPIILFTLHAGTIQYADLQSRGINAVVAKTDPLHTLLEKAQSLLQA